MLKSKEKDLSWKEPSLLPRVSDSHSWTRISLCLMFAADSWYWFQVLQAKTYLKPQASRKKEGSEKLKQIKGLGIKNTKLFFQLWGLLSLGSFSSCSEKNYFWLYFWGRRHYSRKCNNKTWSSCISSHSFCSKCWICLYLSVNEKEKKIGTWRQSLSLVYLCDCEICERTLYLTGYILLQVLSLHYYTGEGMR